MARYDFDLITIGAGSGGVRATRLAGGYGARTAIVEESRVGGTCVMRGCVSKKLLVMGAHFADDFADSRGFGWAPGDARFDWSALIHNKNVELDRLEGVYNRILETNSVRRIDGRAVLSDAHTVTVNGQSFTAEIILIATGSRPSLPAIPGIEHAITSNEALDLSGLPNRVAIVGGGYIAVEFAGIFNGLGAQVTEIIRGDQVLRGFDADVRATLGDEMAKKGIDIRSGTVVQAIAKDDQGGLRLTLAGPGGVAADSLVVDAVLYATGRTPNTAGIGLAEVGVALDDAGGVVVDDDNRTSVANIYAVGDCTNRVMLTPVAIAEGRAFTETLFNGTPTRVDYANIPTAVFSQPPVGTVGLAEHDAGTPDSVDVYLSRFRPMKHTLTGRDEMTMMKLVVDRRSDRVVGCHMVGVDAPEIIQGLGVALKCGATKAQFDATIGIHPTAAEEFVTMREPRQPPAAAPEAA